MANIQKPNSQITDFVNFIHKNGEIKPFVKNIHLITINVVGLDYIKDIDEILSEIDTGDRLELIREATNEYDKKAILVKYNGEKIGYVPRQDNEILASLMDAGKYLYAIVDDYGVDEIYEGYPTRFLRVKINLKEDF